MITEIKCGIYCIENKINHKKYIGQSKNIINRWYQHKHELKKGVHDNDYLQKSWNKYGSDNFEFKILELCSEELLDEKENYYIELYDALNRDFGYNLKTGGQLGGSKLSEESKLKLSDSIKESYSDELKEKRSQDALNQWANPDVKEKIMGKNNGMYGKHHSEETRKKISEKRNQRTNNQKQVRQVLCVELNKIFKNASIAARYFNMSSSANILNVCYGKRQTTGGYHWKFVE